MEQRSTSDDEIGRRLADTRSISLTRRVTVPGSAGAGTGDSGGRPLTLPVCLHHRVVQEPEPMQAEPEAAPSEEPEPAPPASTAPEAGMVPAGTSGGDPEPAGAGTGDSGGRPLTLTACLHHRVVQEPEPMQAEPEAAPSEEPEPAPPASTAPEAGMVPAGTSGGDPEPAGGWAPAHSEADSVREELGSAPVPGPAFAMDPAPDNTCASALESAPTPPPEERPEPLLVPTALLHKQLPFVLSPDPGNLQERFVPDVYIFPFCYILILILSLHVLYTIYHLF
ncbi:nematocyst expressed protein 3-like isoform X3 [Mustela lutreola]|uniref:nematocyst expressed protein 3-like isoform X3 n=1 Tax=Mustela lutreola TaxID=9666 RepID=UPI0027977F0F|nr:nematocyst expressed protein 3-like isoform X3 [Mustela lutreola]